MKRVMNHSNLVRSDSGAILETDQQEYRNRLKKKQRESRVNEILENYDKIYSRVVDLQDEVHRLKQRIKELED